MKGDFVPFFVIPLSINSVYHPSINSVSDNNGYNEDLDVEYTVLQELR